MSKENERRRESTEGQPPVVRGSELSEGVYTLKIGGEIAAYISVIAVAPHNAAKGPAIFREYWDIVTEETSANASYIAFVVPGASSQAYTLSYVGKIDDGWKTGHPQIPPVAKQLNGDDIVPPDPSGVKFRRMVHSVTQVGA